jgi:E3 SUMO-protein ligase PIAS1
MASITQYDVEATIRKVKGTGMVNKILQLICVGEGLTKYGVKAELQQKIIDSELVPNRYRCSLAALYFPR